MPYVLDSNVFIQAKNFYYGFDFAPAFWDWIHREHETGTLYSVERVRDELIAGDDALAEWAHDRGKEFFLPPDEDILPSLATLATWARSGHYEAGAANQFLDSADYYLVAHAHAHGFEVVTHERPSDSRKKIKIPDACIAHQVKTANLYGVIRTTKARFVLDKAS
jgi:hypothetical protein